MKRMLSLQEEELRYLNIYVAKNGKKDMKLLYVGFMYYKKKLDMITIEEKRHIFIGRDPKNKLEPIALTLGMTQEEDNTYSLLKRKFKDNEKLFAFELLRRYGI